MAIESPNTSRRHLLAGIAAASIATAAIVPSASAHTAQWSQAMREYETKNADYRAYAARFTDTANLSDDEYDRLDKLCEAMTSAEDRLMMMSAPDNRALKWKLERLLAVENDGFTAGWSGEYARQTIADASRLAA